VLYGLVLDGIEGECRRMSVQEAGIASFQQRAGEDVYKARMFAANLHNSSALFDNGMPSQYPIYLHSYTIRLGRHD